MTYQMALGIEQVAVKMLRRGKSFEDIHLSTDLSFQRIQELANSLKAQQ